MLCLLTLHNNLYLGKILLYKIEYNFDFYPCLVLVSLTLNSVGRRKMKGGGRLISIILPISFRGM